MVLVRDGRPVQCTALAHDVCGHPRRPEAPDVNCNLSGATGQGSIDLRGTPFSVNNSALTQGGSLARGSATPGNLGQTVRLQGGGSCGWFSLCGLSNPVNQNGGALALTYGPSSH